LTINAGINYNNMTEFAWASKGFGLVC